MLTKRTERCAVARREPDGGHAAQHLCNIEMASRRLCPLYDSAWPKHALVEPRNTIRDARAAVAREVSDIEVLKTFVRPDHDKTHSAQTGCADWDAMWLRRDA